MQLPRRAVGGLFAVIVALAACGPESVSVSPTPTAARSSAAPTTAAPTATVARTATPTPPATTAPTTPPPTPTSSPGGSPNAACPAQTGGSQANRAIVTDIRIAHNPGFDRIVFEMGPNPGPGTYGVPPYRIEVASTFAGVSGQPVTVAGNAFFGVLFQNTDAHNPNTGAAVLPAAKADQKPSTPLIREARVYEDFEATVRTAVGLDRLVCPTVLTLSNPVRVVFDFPTPP